jgi:hypothetical protein
MAGMAPKLFTRAIHGLAAGCAGRVALEIASDLDQDVRARPRDASARR